MLRHDSGALVAFLPWNARSNTIDGFLAQFVAHALCPDELHQFFDKHFLYGI